MRNAHARIGTKGSRRRPFTSPVFRGWLAAWSRGRFDTGVGPKRDDVSTYERAGLLDGLDDIQRPARLALLNELAADGVSVETMKQALDENRLPLLQLDRVLSGEPRYTPREAAELAGISVDFLLAMRQAIGVARPDPDEKAMDDRDVETGRTFALMLAAGLPEEGLLEVARVLGSGLAQVVEAMRMVFARAVLAQNPDEHELALRNAEAADQLVPLVGPLMEHTLQLHMRDQVRNQQFGVLDLSAGTPPDMREVYVGFSDLVGFTRLGERIEVSELGRLLGRFTDLAMDAVRPPTRLVKTIGDALMFVGPSPAALLETAIGLTERVEAASPELPAIRSGLAAGLALSREGDWYGPPVNLASRVTGVARHGSVLATEDFRNAVDDERYTWSNAGEWKLKGLRRPVHLHRARRAGAERD
jgi:adenylate cyclase